MKKLYNYIDESLHNPHSKHYIQFELAITGITSISVVAIILETVSSFNQYAGLFHIVELVAVIFFSIEYLARLITSKKRLRYVFSFWGIVDILAIAPTYISFANLTFLKSVRTLRTLRLLRLLRTLKLAHLFAQNVHETDTQAEINHQNIRIYFFTLALSILLSGSLLYAIEHEQMAYSSIPLAMLQAAKILLGGLGQAPTRTIWGDLVILIIRFVGLALFGLLISIVGGVLNQFIFGDKPVKK